MGQAGSTRSDIHVGVDAGELERPLEERLAEELQLGVGMRAVELDDVGECLRPVARTCRQVEPHPRLDLGDQHNQLVVEAVVDHGFDVGVVDDSGAGSRELLKGELPGRVGVRVVAPKDVIARNPDPFAREASVSGVRGVVDVAVSQDGQQRRRIGHGGGHRARGVLRRRDRHDARGRDEADGRLDPDHAVECGRAGDRAVGLRPDGVLLENM